MLCGVEKIGLAVKIPVRGHIHIHLFLLNDEDVRLGIEQIQLRLGPGQYWDILEWILLTLTLTLTFDSQVRQFVLYRLVILRLISLLWLVGVSQRLEIFL